MKKTPFVEIDKRGILTAIISEGIMIMVILIAILTPAIDFTDKAVKIILVLGGVRLGLAIFSSSAATQRKNCRRQ